MICVSYCTAWCCVVGEKKDGDGLQSRSTGDVRERREKGNTDARMKVQVSDFTGWV